MLTSEVVQLLLERSELGGLLVSHLVGALTNCGWIEDVVNGRSGYGVVEVLVFVVPLHTEVMLAGVLERGVNGFQVLRAPH